MNRYKLLNYGGIVLVVSYIVIAVVFVMNFMNLKTGFAKAEENYFLTIENNIAEVLNGEKEEIASELALLVEKYPLDIVVQEGNQVVYHSLPFSMGDSLLGAINPQAILVEGQGNYNNYFVWYAVYHMPDTVYFESFLSQQFWIILAAFCILSALIVIIYRVMGNSLSSIKQAIAKAKNYDFDEIEDERDVINKEFKNFTHDLSSKISVVSKRYTELETSLQLERHKLESTINLSRSLVHDFKTTIHHELMENMYYLESEKPISDEAKQLATTNVELSDKLMHQVNEALQIMKNDIYAISKEKEEIDLIQLTREMLRLFTIDFNSKNISVDFITSEQATILENSTLVRLLLHNLLTNMAKYATRDTEVTIEVLQENEGVFLQFRNHASPVNMERIKKSEFLFNVIEVAETEEHNYSSNNGIFLIRYLIELMQGKFELTIEQTEVIMSIAIPQGVQYEEN